MNATVPSCLLLIESDNVLANQITTLAEERCPVVRWGNADEAGQWLRDHAGVILIVTDPHNAQPVTNLLMNNAGLRHVPVLITQSQQTADLAHNLPRHHITDLLDFTEEPDSWQTKINHYIDLNTQLSAASYTSPVPAYFQFRLPWWKRGIDIAVSLSALLVLSPLMLVVALLIKLDSKGPILYKSARAGTNFRIFDMYKFRTMKAMADRLLKDLKDHNIYAKTPEQSESDVNGQDYQCEQCQLLQISCRQPLVEEHQTVCEKKYLTDFEDAVKFMKFRNDPRITRLGTFLRNSSIDELPQLLNILFGDMSLVGNRPLPLYEAEKLTTDESAQRFAGPAGLTGLWQVKKRAKGEGPVTDSERIALDIEYASTFSFKTDMYIIWQTLFSVWQKENV